jgi:hypothetical protein
MSVEHILRDTSMARMIVAWSEGTVTIDTGLERATTRLARASKNNPKGRWRRKEKRGGEAARRRDRLE